MTESDIQQWLDVIERMLRHPSVAITRSIGVMRIEDSREIWVRFEPNSNQETITITIGGGAQETVIDPLMEEILAAAAIRREEPQ